MSKIIEPTVGRIVYYYDANTGIGRDGGQNVPVNGPFAAIITRVWSNACVNVAVQKADGSGQFGRTSILLLKPGERRPETGQWVEWMPHQIAQTFAANALNKAVVDSPQLIGETTNKTPPGEAAIDQKIQAAGANAPRVTPEDLDREIAAGSVHYFTALDGVLGHEYCTVPVEDEGKFVIEPAQAETLGIITICCIVLANNFKVIGTTAPVSASNFRAEIGREAAFNNARNQLWPLLGFRLADKLHAERTSHADEAPPPTEISIASRVSALPQFRNVEVPLILDIVTATLVLAGHDPVMGFCQPSKE